MDRLGEYMLRRGLISRDDLARALHIQRRDGGLIGEVLARQGACTRAQADFAWVDMTIRDPLEAAIEIISDGLFASFAERDIEFLDVIRRDMIVEDMLHSASLRTHENCIEGTVQLVVGERRSLPVTFTMDHREGVASFDENSENIVRRWTALIARSPARSPVSAAAAVPDAFAAQLEALLRGGEQAA